MLNYFHTTKQNTLIKLTIKPFHPIQRFKNMLCRKLKVSSKCSLYKTLKTFATSDGNASTSPRKKDFNEIPTPRGLPFIGTTLSLWAAGSGANLHRYIDKRHKQLGPVFKEKIGPVSCVFVSDINGMRSVFAQEGKYPIHLQPESWTVYNSYHNHSRGLFFMDGEEWHHFRRLLNPLLLNSNVTYIDDACSAVADLIVNNIKSKSVNNAEFPNLEEELYKWSLDVIVAVLLGNKHYQKARINLEEDIKHLASIVHLIFETTVKLQLIPAAWAAKFKTPAWRNFEKCVDNALLSSSNLIDNLFANYPNGDGLLHKMKETNMSKSDISRIVIDLVLAAGDTTAYTMEWILYMAAKHEDVQERLRDELRRDKNKNSDAERAPILKNFIRETMRLYPVAPFLTRILPEGGTISDYNVPAGTLAILSIFTSGRDPAYVENPEQFLPDRWNRADPKSRIVKLATLPFAMGSRSCIGQKLAENQLRTLLAKIVDNFNVELVNKNDDVDVIMKMVAVPSRRIRLKFTPLL